MLVCSARRLGAVRSHLGAAPSRNVATPACNPEASAPTRTPGQAEVPNNGTSDEANWAVPKVYRYWLPIQTRWQALYYHLFDTISNHFLITHCSLVPSSPTSPIGLVVSSTCRYLAPLAFPDPVLAGLSVGKVGRSSVEWRIALWPAEASSTVGNQIAGVITNGRDDVTVAVEHRLKLGTGCAAYGSFTHVFVDPQTRKSVEMPKAVRDGVERLKQMDDS